MKCDEVLALLDPLLDNELPTQPAALVMEHLTNCPSCQDVWDARLALRDRFRQLSAGIPVPAKSLERIDQALQRDVRQQSSTRFWRLIIRSAASAVLVAAAVSVFRHEYLDHHSPLTIPEIVSSLKKVSPSSSAAGSKFNLDELSSHAGFKIASLNFPNWRLISADTVKLPGHSECLVRLTYVQQNGSQQITCYEACKGQIKVAGLNEHNIGGRYICCGKINNFSVIYWLRDGRDHLLISSLSEAYLMSLALSA